MVTWKARSPGRYRHREDTPSAKLPNRACWAIKNSPGWSPASLPDAIEYSTPSSSPPPQLPIDECDDAETRYAWQSRDLEAEDSSAHVGPIRPESEVMAVWQWSLEDWQLVTDSEEENVRRLFLSHQRPSLLLTLPTTLRTIHPDLLERSEHSWCPPTSSAIETAVKHLERHHYNNRRARE
jgi:hypothetical protein